MFKTVIISFSFKTGGAAIAAHKMTKLLAKGTTSFITESITQDNAGKFQFLKRLISFILSKLQFDGNPIKHSLNLFSYKPVLKSFKNKKDTIHHLHWINNDTLSIFDFDKIPTGSVISLHDEWLYCGSEHAYNAIDDSNQFINGYSYFNKGVLGINWNSLIWKVKYKKLAHRDDLIYTVPSNWMLERAKLSAILKRSDIRLLPNTIDSEVFKPASESTVSSFRFGLNIELDSFVIVYASTDDKKNNLKGIDLLNNTLQLLQSKLLNSSFSKIILINFGGDKGEHEVHGFRNISLGYIDDPVDLAILYSSADCVLVPSIIESFGQVAAEALSCCTPVVSFDTSGLRDIVHHRSTGLVAREFNPSSLCEQLIEMTKTSEKARLSMGENGRKHIIKNFSFPILTNKYLNILQDAIALKQSSRQ